MNKRKVTEMKNNELLTKTFYDKEGKITKYIYKIKDKYKMEIYEYETNGNIHSVIYHDVKLKNSSVIDMKYTGRMYYHYQDDSGNYFRANRYNGNDELINRITSEVIKDSYIAEINIGGGFDVKILNGIEGSKVITVSNGSNITYSQYTDNIKVIDISKSKSEVNINNFHYNQDCICNGKINDIAYLNKNNEIYSHLNIGTEYKDGKPRYSRCISNKGTPMEKLISKKSYKYSNDVDTSLFITNQILTQTRKFKNEYGDIVKVIKSNTAFNTSIPDSVKETNYIIEYFENV